MHGEYTITHVLLRQRGIGNDAPTKSGEFYLCDEYNQSSPGTAIWRKIGNFELAAIAEDQTTLVQESKGRYLKVNITGVRSGDGTTSLAEISVRGY